MKLPTFFLVFLAFLFFPFISEAIVDPLASPNNQFGIHISNESDLDAAANLVNSSGGDWGYVTLVIQETDRDRQKWQAVFDDLRARHLIPIVRIATRYENDHWIKPRTADIEPWVDFLDSLNWVTTNRYVVLFNEPNHAKEWGSQVSPEEYAQTIRLYHQHLKSASSDFFVLPAGLDLAADGQSGTLSAREFLNQMHKSDPEVFNLLDGWTSHSYPNPNFSGSVYAQGAKSIRGYQWELAYLKSLGISKNFPVFITETGWIHSNGKITNGYNLSPAQVATNFETAFSQIWRDSNIVAITPFILNYPEPPFDYFSWKIPGDNPDFHPQYQIVQTIPKNAGLPAQNHNSVLIKRYFPDALIVGSKYLVAIRYVNTGQSIWNPDQFSVNITTNLPDTSVSVDPVPPTQPYNPAKIWLTLTSPQTPGTYQLTFQLRHQDQNFGPPTTYTFEVLENTAVNQFKLWLERLFHSNDFLPKDQ